jgi:hypothetical protein
VVVALFVARTARWGLSWVGTVQMVVALLVARTARWEPSWVGTVQMAVALFVARTARWEPSWVGTVQMAVASLKLVLAAAGGEEALGTEDRHEYQDDAEHHALVLGRLELCRQVGEVIAEDDDAGVLQLVQPEG